jgi:protein-arginine kinase activator protein McsA
MLDLFLEFLVYFFGDKAFKKLRSRLKNLKLMKSEHTAPFQKAKNMSDAIPDSMCTGCGRPFKEPPVYESGKPWCLDCYKNSVLKIREMD